MKYKKNKLKEHKNQPICITHFVWLYIMFSDLTIFLYETHSANTIIK